MTVIHLIVFRQSAPTQSGANEVQMPTGGRQYNTPMIRILQGLVLMDICTVD